MKATTVIATWPVCGVDSTTADEMVIQFDQGRDYRVLILPAFFDEANKLRRQTVHIMRRLDASGIDSFLPDFPGWNESLADLSAQSLLSWAEAARAAVDHFKTTHLLTIRAGALLAPDGSQGWSYAPQTGPKLLRGMLRAGVLAAREEGRQETQEALLEEGLVNGLTLAGWHLGAEMIKQLHNDNLGASDHLTTIDQKTLPGPGLWLRAEPDENPEQADAIAAAIVSALFRK